MAEKLLELDDLNDKKCLEHQKKIYFKFKEVRSLM